MIFRARLGFERWELCIPDSFLRLLLDSGPYFQGFLSF